MVEPGDAREREWRSGQHKINVTRRHSRRVILVVRRRGEHPAAGNFKIRRKTDDDDVETQDAKSTNVQVCLDQHFYNSFVIKDGEASKSFQELVTIYMLPAMQVIARSVDRAVLGRVHQFLAGLTGRVGRLLNLDEANSKDLFMRCIIGP